MTKEEFIEKLKTYSYEMVGDKLIVNDKGSVYLVGLTSMPSNVEFNNLGYVDIRNVTSIPSDVKFNNDGYVDLGSATSISSGVEFNNEGYINIESLIHIAPSVRLNNSGWTIFGGKINNKLNIKGIGTKKLFNVMISKGMFI